MFSLSSLTLALIAVFLAACTISLEQYIFKNLIEDLLLETREANLLLKNDQEQKSTFKMTTVYQ
jgi:hypothetical protein